MTYPVSVVIPTIESRYDFLVKRCLPSVLAADPEQIIVVFGPGNGNQKRNAGSRGATQKFILFVDDDSEVAPQILPEMLAALERDPQASFAYSDFSVVVEHSDEYTGPIVTGVVYPGTWNASRLTQGNYIDVTSLIRRDHFSPFCFDSTLERFQDWDLWLTLSSIGCHGTYVQKNLFTKFVIDRGVTARIEDRPAREAVLRKHKLL